MLGVSGAGECAQAHRGAAREVRGSRAGMEHRQPAEKGLGNQGWVWTFGWGVGGGSEGPYDTC